MTKHPLEKAVEATHGGSATLLEVVPVKETYKGQTIAEGGVGVLELAGHPTATRAYAWHDIDGSIVAVLHQSPVDSPEAAVRAALVEQHRRQS